MFEIVEESSTYTLRMEEVIPTKTPNRDKSVPHYSKIVAFGGPIRELSIKLCSAVAVFSKKLDTRNLH